MSEEYHCGYCGHHEGPAGVGICEHCPHCPPWPCDECGELNTTLDLCSCWIDITQMPLADVKALLADDFNVGVDGRLS